MVIGENKEDVGPGLVGGCDCGDNPTPKNCRYEQPAKSSVHSLKSRT
jgi:hypothetical protein